MSSQPMSPQPNEVAAKTERIFKEIELKISELLSQQMRIASRLAELREIGDSADQDRINGLIRARKDTSRVIARLARRRTQLLDELPVIVLATGELDVIAEKLDRESKKFGNLVRRINKSLKLLRFVEDFLTSIVTLLK